MRACTPTQVSVARGRRHIPTEPSDLVTLLGQANQGDAEAEARLFGIVYEELRVVARNLVKNERPGGLVTPTVLCHDAYLRLISRDGVLSSGQPVQNRRQLFFVFRRAMLQLLIESHRKSTPRARGSLHDQAVEHLTESIGVPRQRLTALGQALTQLERDYLEGYEVAVLKYTGCTYPQMADILGVSQATIGRRWNLARAILQRSMSQGDRDAE